MQLPANHALSRTLFASPLLQPILTCWPEIALPNCWLVAGAVAQTFWNHRYGFDPAHGVLDIDLVYFDDADLSSDTETRHGERLRARFADIPAWLDVKNEARVHLWYAEKFGFEIAPYLSVEAAIETFPTTATTIGVQPAESGLEIYAPFGLDDLLNLCVRPNKKQITPDIYEAKIARWRTLWPALFCEPWETR
jgi:hypothetical protein